MPVFLLMLAAIAQVLLQSIVAPGMSYALALAEASAARDPQPATARTGEVPQPVAFTAYFTRASDAPIQNTPELAIAPVSDTVASNPVQPEAEPADAEAADNERAERPVGGGAAGVLSRPARPNTPKTYLPHPTSALRLTARGYVAATTPAVNLLPDSEFVNSPTAVGFDLVAAVTASQGYITRYRERMEDGNWLTGPQILQRIALQYSVHPRLLIAMLEYQSGWVSQGQPSYYQLAYPFGRGNPANAGSLYHQARWAASVMNAGYYGRRLGTRNQHLAGADGSWRAAVPGGLTAGTHAVQALLARTHEPGAWTVAMGTDGDGFLATYRALFGDPWRFELGLLAPYDLVQPELGPPWPANERWFYTGGPHPAWDDGSPWAAIDFAAPGAGGCAVAPNWAVAVADGVVTRSDDGELVLALDPTKDERVGWSVFYMHLATQGRVPVGTAVRKGDRLGHPSCEGGYSTGAHLHLARKYNGEWVSAAGRTPFVLDGWVPMEGGAEYEGAISRSGVVRRAIAGRVPGANSLP